MEDIDEEISFCYCNNVACVFMTFTNVAAVSDSTVIGINVVLKSDITSVNLAKLAVYGKVLNKLPALDALTMRAPKGNLAAIRALPFVEQQPPMPSVMGHP